ncbi:hypothetical protein K9B35_01620 [Sphingomonas sp. R647]|uniref:asparagine synthase-related protein n=1 Tax=Sphingomonas sp. R647 TaxID=2875233 RepID=UPI001CD618AA|nr:asparagine synthase-related protein [Sphingomonas sp. R647]MCA1196654.1 hypothetical protein [Sphingomonas sp. R647]
MTAIAGLCYYDGRPVGPKLARMLDAQARYGPDDRRDWSAGGVGLGRNLMHMLPEDRFDRQPLTGGGGRYRLVADVRLDERDDLARALGIAEPDARDLSDAALVLAAFERWGSGCFDRLYGDFAVAIWDVQDRALLLARDPFGDRPIHYYRSGSLIAFASMPKGLHALDDVPYRPDADLLARSLDGIFPAREASCFQHVLKVPRGSCLRIDQQSVREVWRWQAPHTRLKLTRPEDYHAALREQLDRAVQARLRGAETVATQCSSGLDSGAVTATAARLQGALGRRVVAFTAVPRPGFNASFVPGRIVDEGPLAATLAARYPNVEHVRIDTRGRTPLDGLARLFQDSELPAGNLANEPWANAIFDGVRDRGIGVLLIGQQGNMTISYNGQLGPASWLAGGAWRTFAREARAMARDGQPWRSIAALAIGPNMPPALWGWLAGALGRAPDAGAIRLIAPSRRVALGPSWRHARAGDQTAGRDSIAARVEVMQRGDGANYGKAMLAQWRIDRRDPTADRRLTEFCLTVPEDQYLRDGISSAMVRVGLADRLPEAIRMSRARGLQASDWHIGMVEAHDRLVEEVEAIAASDAAARVVDVIAMRQLVADWPEHGWDRPQVQARYRSALLSALAIGHFLRLAEQHLRTIPQRNGGASCDDDRC